MVGGGDVVDVEGGDVVAVVVVPVVEVGSDSTVVPVVDAATGVVVVEESSAADRVEVTAAGCVVEPGASASSDAEQPEHRTATRTRRTEARIGTSVHDATADQGRRPRPNGPGRSSASKQAVEVAAGHPWRRTPSPPIASFKGMKRNREDGKSRRINPLRIIVAALVIAALIKELRLPKDQRTWHGKLGDIVPYDFRMPTVYKFKATLWNPGGPIIVGRVFGVGWTLNFGALVERIKAMAGEASASKAA